MSYETLIQGVADDLSISRHETMGLIESLISVIGHQSFTRRIFDKCYSQVIVTSFLKHFTGDLLEEKISYECNFEGGQEVTENLKGLCVFCDSSIIGNFHHETESLYQLKRDDSEDFYKWLTEQKEQHYLNPKLKHNADELIKIKKDIVPFIGSGLSLPFGIPTWGGLLKEMKPSFDKPFLEETFNDYIESGELMEGLDFIKKKSLNFSKETHLQNKIVSIIHEKEKSYVDEDKHNYIDLIKFKSNFYITTNYDLILSKVITDYDDYTMAKTFGEMEDSFSMHAGKNQVLHIHGHVNKPKEMLVSDESYQEFYENPKNKTKLAALIGSKTLLFVGFSFNDAFFEKLYTELVDAIGGVHYIIIANPNFDTVRKFLDKDLRVIGLNVKKNGNVLDSQDYANALRVFIRYIEGS
jgi:hypothetical protein